jgi:hypothetical protein
MLVRLSNAYDNSVWVPNDLFGQKIPQFNLFLVWVPISEERKIKSRETILENAGDDREVALLRR